MMHGRNVFASDYNQRDAVFAARDRCDETVDRIAACGRIVTCTSAIFIPSASSATNAYKDGKSIVQRLRALHDAGKLDALTETLLFSPTRPAEELYDVDPRPLAGAKPRRRLGPPPHARGATRETRPLDD